MTIDAQAALRRIIEAYSHSTRFCIICNYISKIIDPLASRCVKFRFSAISESAQRQRLGMICEKESIDIESPAVLDQLIEISEGALRRSINTLQTCSSFIKGTKRALKQSDIEKISGVVPEGVISTIFDKIESASGYADIQQLAQDLILDGYDTQQLICRLSTFYMTHQRVKDLHKARISEIIAESDFKMI
jgi:replication factor C subunit 2/4